MENLLQDLRYALRILVKRPVFTLVAGLWLALGNGPNTAIFSLVDAFLWRTLPVEAPETLVSVFTRDERNPGNAPLTHLNWKDYRDMSRSFSGVLGYTFAPVSLQGGGGEPTRSFVILASGNYFDLLGIRAQIGRTFLPEEDGEPGAHPVVGPGESGPFSPLAPGQTPEGAQSTRLICEALMGGPGSGAFRETAGPRRNWGRKADGGDGRDGPRAAPAGLADDGLEL